jgi:HPt (histidine-containing phosphotransfer) domain-containing protein
MLDDAVGTFLRWLLTLCDWEMGELAASNSGASSTSVFEALAHVLRIYLANLRVQLADDQGGDRVIAAQRLHGRCRAVGLCAVLHAFHKMDDSPEDDLKERQEEGGASSHVASMKRMRAASKANAPPLPPRSEPDERRVLRALSHAVTQLVGCRC